MGSQALCLSGARLTHAELSGNGAGEAAVTTNDSQGQREAPSHEDSGSPRPWVTCRPCCWAEHLQCLGEQAGKIFSKTTVCSLHM